MGIMDALMAVASASAKQGQMAAKPDPGINTDQARALADYYFNAVLPEKDLLANVYNDAYSGNGKMPMMEDFGDSSGIVAQAMQNGYKPPQDIGSLGDGYYAPQDFLVPSFSEFIEARKQPNPGYSFDDFMDTLVSNKKPTKKEEK